MSNLSDRDDSLHAPPNDDRWWSETCWFGFDDPEHQLSATIYPVFRPNLGICSLGVYVWDASAHEPWAVPYGRSFWHLAMPVGDLVDLRLQGLSYDRIEPLRRYRVAYRDADLIELELEFTGLRPPYEAFVRNGVGHFDQPCRVVGEIRLRVDAPITIDTLGMRDRTWSGRADDRSGHGAAYTYGHASADEHFLLLTSLQGNEGSFSTGVFSGYLVRDGVHAKLESSTRRVVERKNGYPTVIEIEATDVTGRRLEAVGHTRSRLANQATPAQFAWMSFTEWATAGGDLYGEDQEVWSPDRLGPELKRLAVGR